MIDAGPRDVVALIISIVVAVALAFILYRTTTPSLPRWLRLALEALRFVAVLIIILLVTDPVLRLTSTSRSDPVVAVLLDDSRSMAFPGSGAKLDRAKRIAIDTLVDRLKAKADVRFFTFSDVAGEISAAEIDDVDARGSRTDLVMGLRSAIDGMDTRPAAFVILSDGGVNFGEDALHYSSSLRIPVHTISLAGDEPTPDISVDRVETSGAAYANSIVPVWLHLTGRHSGAVETEVTISDSAGTVLTKQVVIPGTGARTRVAADIEAGEIGLHRFSVNLAPFEGEEVTSNNTMAFSLKVIKGKIRVCLVAPHPTWDFAFARRSLDKDPNIDASVMFTASGGPRVRMEDEVRDLSRVIADLDVVVVFRGATLGAGREELKQFVRDGGGLLLVSVDPSTSAWEDASPFVIASSSRGADLMYAPREVEAGGDHEVMKVKTDGYGWSSLPPVPVDGSLEGARDESTVLLSGVSGDRVMPFVAVMRYGLGRVVAFSPFDLWRWDFVPRGFGIETSAFSGLLLNSIGWLTEKDEIKRLALSVSRDTYLWGEPADISARVMDENLKPVSGASVQGEIRDAVSGEIKHKFAMGDRAGGSHAASVDFLPPSRYIAGVTARVGGEVYAEERLEFSVDERGLEDFNVDGDNLALEQIAAATGGTAYRAQDSARLAEELNPGSTIVRRYRDLRLRLTLACFLVLAGVLGVEWLVRKRKMLV
ncbi:MAG: vWA domain-containing protein [Candidatus Eisenbacteria bacterium]